jgi:hypothetical protein
MTRWYTIRPDGSEAVIGADDLGPARETGCKVYEPSVVASRLSNARSRYTRLRREYVWLCDGPTWSKSWTPDETAVSAARDRMDKAEAVWWRWSDRLIEVRATRPPREIISATKGT